jgi:hypothetical protein
MAALGSAHEAEALAHQLASQLESQVAQHTTLQSKLDALELSNAQQVGLAAQMMDATEGERERHAREMAALRVEHSAVVERLQVRTATVVQQQTAAIQRLQQASGAERAALITSASAASLAATEVRFIFHPIEWERIPSVLRWCGAAAAPPAWCCSDPFLNAVTLRSTAQHAPQPPCERDRERVELRCNSQWHPEAPPGRALAHPDSACSSADL